MNISPLRYTADVEKPEGDEAALANSAVETMMDVSRKTYADTKHGMRGAHAKSHALLTGKLTVLDNLPAPLAQGLFAKAGSYPIVMRFSTAPGDILPDTVSTPRGLAIKIIGTEGARLPGSENDVTQDFVMVNGPAFHVSNVKAFLASIKPVVATTDKMEGAKEVISSVLRGTEQLLEAVGGQSATLKTLGGEPTHHPLGETYFTQVPLLNGAFIAKFSIAPVSTELKALTGADIDVKASHTAIREEMLSYFAQNGGEWELRAQLCTDIEAMPVEDASTVWPEDQSPYIAVARISVPPQEAWSEARSLAIDDGMSFSPWHGLAMHRPLGSVMRVRKLVYEKVFQFRASKNGRTLQEPTSIDHLPSNPQAAA